MMNIEAIAASQPLFDVTALPANVEPPAQGTGFGNLFVSELNAVNAKVTGATHAVQRLALGDTQNLHQVMTSMEDARLSFQLLVQVRNRVLEAYQDIMRMPV